MCCLQIYEKQQQQICVYLYYCNQFFKVEVAGSYVYKENDIHR